MKFLLIAESPPASGGYFYYDCTTGKDSLFSETMKALELFPESKPMLKDLYKVPLLKEFQRQGFFLIDVSYEPVNGKLNNERRRIIEREIPRLIQDAKKLNPETIIIVKVSIFNIVKEALTKASLGERILNKEGLPFPSTGNQKKYRQMLRSLLYEQQKINQVQK